MSSLQKSLHLSNDEDWEEKDGCDHMAQKSAPPVWLHDIAAALGLLTRLPVAIDTDLAMKRSAAATWAYPVVGILLGGLSLLIFVIAVMIGLPSLIAVIFIIGFNVIVTGAMHQDGLADSADGLWGGWTVERRLEIMKDSHIGVYGVCAVVLFLLLYVATLSTVAFHPLLAVGLIGGAALSRAMIVVVMSTLPNARGGGLSQSVGRPPMQSMWGAVGIGCGVTVVLGLLIGQVWAAVLIICVGAAATFACGAIAKRKIKGQTGDILGATQQVSEVAMLITLCAFA